MNKSDCIFCKISTGVIPAHKIYEDDKVLAFLDISPVKPGHTLLIPKDHYDMMLDTPDELVAYIFTKAKFLMLVIKKALAVDFVVVSVVGVEVSHFHIHLTPRQFNDNLANFWPQGKYEPGEAEEYTKKIIEAL